MNEGLFEYLRSQGFTGRRHQLNFKKIIEQLWPMSRRKILSTAEAANEAIVYASRSAVTPFEFSADASLGGAPVPCPGFDCRIQRIEELAYFAGLYADRVLIPSPFAHLLPSHDLGELRCGLALAIVSSLYLKPLVTKGIVEYTQDAYTNACVRCLSTASQRSVRDFRRLVDDLTSEYEQRVKYYIEVDGRDYFATAEGPDELFDSRLTSMHLESVPQAVKDLVRRRRRRRKMLLSDDLVDQLSLPKNYAMRVVREIIERDLTMARFRTGHLTSRAIDLRFAGKIPAQHESDKVLSADLAHTLPVLRGVTPADLIKLRENEGDAFKTYQVALRKAAKESTSPANLAAVFAEVVEPEIRRMNAALKTARRSLIRSAAGRVVGTSASVAIALGSGVIPRYLVPLIGVISGARLVRDLVPELCELYKQEPQNARQNPFYFMWRMSQTHS